MFLYKHRDGRVGTGPGTWFAIKDALGEDAKALVERSESELWDYKVIQLDEPGMETMTSVRQMPLIVDGEEIGMFHEATGGTNASSKKSPVTAGKNDEHVDSRLSGDRKDKGQEPLNATLEEGVESDRKDNVDQTHQSIEKNLRDKKTGGPNEGASGLVEKRLNEAKTTLYPHRNEEAWARTGQKRPINALPEELGRASEDKKRERWTKANKSGDKRILDKDVGKQLDLPKTKIEQKTAFNLHEKRVAKLKPYEGYLAYKGSTAGGWGDKFSKVREIDAKMQDIMSKNASLSKEQQSEIDALKEDKARALAAVYRSPRDRARGDYATKLLNKIDEQRLREAPLNAAYEKRMEQQKMDLSQQQAMSDEKLLQKTIGKIERAKQMKQKTRVDNPDIYRLIQQQRPDLVQFITE